MLGLETILGAKNATRILSLINQKDIAESVLINEKDN